MIQSILDDLARPDRMPAGGDSAPLRRAWAALRHRRWRRARPFMHLNEHLRRDIGLPPLGGRHGWE